MNYKLFIDDLRDPSDGSWVVMRSSPAAMNYMDQHGCLIHARIAAESARFDGFSGGLA